MRSGNHEQVTHVAHREDTVTLFPFGHATTSGFSVIPPPQAKPAHPREVGDIIWSIVSNGAEDVSGIAIRYTGIDALVVTSR